MSSQEQANKSILQILDEFENTIISRNYSDKEIFQWLGNLDKDYENSLEYKININGILCNIGKDLSRKSILNAAAKRINTLLIGSEYETKLKYDYGNILFCMANLETSYPYKIEEFLTTNKFTEAREQFSQIPPKDEYYPSAITNSAIILGKFGRTTEAIECINKLLRTDPKFGMALANKASQLEFYYSLAPEKSLRLLEISKTLYQQALLDPKLDQIGGARVRILFDNKIKQLEKYLFSTNSSDNNVIILKKISKYKEFCLNKNFFLNYDFGQYYDELSLKDSLAPPFIEYFDEKKGTYSTHMAESIYFSFHVFNQILEAYVTARQQYYYAVTKKFTRLDKDIYFCYTLDETKHGHQYGLLKIILGCLYNTLDKISHLVFYYFLKTNNPDQKIYFKNLLNDEIRNLIKTKRNHQLLALRDLALDFENGHQYNRLNKIRNRITHSFLNISPFESTRENIEEDEISFEITENELQDAVEELFLIVKSALLYTVNAIRLDTEEKGHGTLGPTREIIKESDIFS